MENNDNGKINITLDNGEVVEGEILFSFDANGEEFVLYTIKDKVFAAKIDENKNLFPVSDDEWPLIEKIYNQYMEDLDQ